MGQDQSVVLRGGAWELPFFEAGDFVLNAGKKILFTQKKSADIVLDFFNIDLHFLLVVLALSPDDDLLFFQLHNFFIKCNAELIKDTDLKMHVIGMARELWQSKLTYWMARRGFLRQASEEDIPPMFYN